MIPCPSCLFTWAQGSPGGSPNTELGVRTVPDIWVKTHISTPRRPGVTENSGNQTSVSLSLLFSQSVNPWYSHAGWNVGNKKPFGISQGQSFFVPIKCRNNPKVVSKSYSYSIFIGHCTTSRQASVIIGWEEEGPANALWNVMVIVSRCRDGAMREDEAQVCTGDLLAASQVFSCCVR